MSRLGIAYVQLEALGLERAEEALERALQGVEEAGRHRPDLILLPECTYRSATHRHGFHPPGVKPMTGGFLLPRRGARRPGFARSAAEPISTGVTSRGTPGRAFAGGQPTASGVFRQALCRLLRRRDGRLGSRRL